MKILLPTFTQLGQLIMVSILLIYYKQLAGYIFYMAYSAFKESTLVLLDAVKNPKMQEELSNYKERKFQVKVDNVFVRPLGNAFSTQIHAELDRNMPLEKAHAILTDIRNSIAERFGMEETVVIPRPV